MLSAREERKLAFALLKNPPLICAPKISVSSAAAAVSSRRRRCFFAVNPFQVEAHLFSLGDNN